MRKKAEEEGKLQGMWARCEAGENSRDVGLWT
jgi:hypothetical protein